MINSEIEKWHFNLVKDSRKPCVWSISMHDCMGENGGKRGGMKDCVSTFMEGRRTRFMINSPKSFNIVQYCFFKFFWGTPLILKFLKSFLNIQIRRREIFF